jgi:hypothetical protein
LREHHRCRGCSDHKTKQKPPRRHLKRFFAIRSAGCQSTTL